MCDSRMRSGELCCRPGVGDLPVADRYESVFNVQRRSDDVTSKDQPFAHNAQTSHL